MRLRPVFGSQENCDDPSKNRQSWGAEHSSTKLSDAEVLEIFTSELTVNELVKMYGVAKHVIWAIRTKRSWGHLTNSLDNTSARTIGSAGRGGKRKNAKLDEKAVLEIYNSPLPRKDLAKLYGVCLRYVFRIKNKTRWKHIHDR